MIEFELAKAIGHTEKPAIMSDPTSTIIIAEAAAAAAGKFVEKAWDSAEKWLATRYKDHYPRAVEKAKDNSRDFVNKLAVKVARLEEQEQVNRTIIDRALEDPSFGVILQKALIGSSQTESQEKHELLAELVTMKLDAPQESLRSVVAPLACEAVTHLTPNQLNIIGIQTVLTLITPSFNESRVQTEADFLKRCDDWANLRGADLREALLIDVKLLQANLSGADLSEVFLGGVDLSWARLLKANLSGAKLLKANLFEANLSGANLGGADLRWVNFGRANLSGANLSGADLSEANLFEANLSGADLEGATLIDANLENANLNGCRIFGISAWNLRVNAETTQSDLIITRSDEATVTVSDIEVAQFIYLLLNRKKLRNVLDTITSKAVLLLGRFSPERKAVLDALADELRKNNLLPIIFDFERSTNRDFTETIRILAGLSLFVIVDITKPKAAPQELTATIPDYQIPFVPILEEGEDPYSMFVDFKKYDWCSNRY